MKHRLERITWLDHAGYSSAKWRYLEELELEPLMLETVGWVVKETKEYIVVVSTLEQDGDLSHSDMCIVKRAILKRKKL